MKWKKRKPEEPKRRGYADFRVLWLQAPYPPPEREAVYLGSAEAYVAAMEFTMPREGDVVKRVVVLSSCLGDASIYFENNSPEGVGGYIGGVRHEHIANNAKAMVAVASESVKHLQPIDGFPLAQPAHVRFIVATKNGKFSVEAEEAEVVKESHPLYGFYAAGQQIITDYRLLHQPK